jgi:hypothetical protein
MGFFDSIFGRAEVQAESIAPSGETTLTVTPQRPAVNRAALRSNGLRENMWAVALGQVGIVTACNGDGIAEVTLANGDGSTKMAIDESGQKLIPAKIGLPAAEIRQAYIEEIPESRRPAVDALRAMGYINASEAA